MACTLAISNVESLLLDLHVTEEDPGSHLDDDVVDEPLDEQQEAWYQKSEAEYEDVLRQLDAYSEVGEVVAQTDSVLAMCVTADSPEVQTVLPSVPTVATTPALTPVITSVTTTRAVQPLPPTQPQTKTQTPSTAASAAAATTAAVASAASSTSSSAPQPSQQALVSAQPSQPPMRVQSMSSGGVILQSPSTVPVSRPSNNAAQPPPGTYQLVMDPRVGGFFVGPVSATGVPAPGTPYRGPVPTSITKNSPRTQPIAAAPPAKNILLPQPTSPAVLMPKAPNKITTWAPTAPASTSASPGAGVSVRAPRGRPPKPAINVVSAARNITPGAILPTGGGANPIHPSMHQFRAGVPPSGIRTGSIVNGPGIAVNNGARILRAAPIPADSREVNFNKLGVGKTFPSLVVVAKPIMRMKDFSSSTISRDRTELDQQVKVLLQNSMTKLTEWLIQQGLVRSSQTCQSHRSATTGEPVNLKLGMYSDVSKFPHSGGYVWICEFCPTQLFVSVFSGSIFEGAPHPPLVLMKLIYHWACQTTASNIVSWVKVESFYVKMFFAQMRAVCTAAVHESYDLMGGPNKRVEVGVISLGTAAQDGSTRNVKVEVLGVMDPDNKLVRLRAIEPLQEGEKNYKRRFVKILEPLAKWVHKKSTILTDFTVDKGTLHHMGFNTVLQVSVNPDTPPDKIPKHSNINVMNYLRRVVPRMFQNALSLLSRQIIQQFLDELVWRERWGPVPSQAYNNIIKHIADQTRANTGTSLLRRLGKISDDPFRDWKYSAEEDIQVVENIPKKTFAPLAPVPPPLAVPVIQAGPSVSAVPSVSANPAVPVGSAVPANPAAPLPPPAPGLAATPPASGTAAAPSPPDILRPSIDMLPLSIQEIDSSEMLPGSPGSTVSRRGRKRAAEPLSASLERPRKRTAESTVKKSGPSYSTLVVGTQLATSLQAYYYGTLEGDPVAMNEEKKELPVLKCSVCVKKFNNNIQLMKHLILHAQFSQFSTELSDVTQCKYCLKTFPTPFSMQTHLEEVHLTTGNNDMCMICTEKFKDTSALIQHMHRTHVALEMPYVCNVCQFRSSIHRDVIDHFYEVHNHGEKMQCPFCLKTVAVCANGRRLGSNISFFLTHIQKHQRRYITKKCTRCALWFVNKWAIREHLQRDHVSFKDVAAVKPAFPDIGEGIKMPLPPAELGPSATLSAVRRGPGFPNRGCQSTTYLLPTLMLDNSISEYLCVECKEEMSESHFPGYSMCSRCRFATCCSTNLKEHMKTFHEIEDKPVFDFSAPIRLPEPLHCVCGYNSNSGNRLAKHLALCDRKSAYPSAAKAKAATVQSASFPPLVTLDDVDNNGEDASDKWLKAFVPVRRDDSESSRDVPDKKSTGADTHSMLNVLGLVRKPSTDDSSLDKAPSDKEDSTEAPVTDWKGTKLKSNIDFHIYSVNNFFQAIVNCYFANCVHFKSQDCAYKCFNCVLLCFSQCLKTQFEDLYALQPKLSRFNKVCV
ncbi:Pogo transposable element with ZNF domain, partial [Gryllus bimaculatus]